jgi:hypothetical protein
MANNVNALMGKAKNAKSNKTDFLKYFSFLYWGLEKNCNRKHEIIKFLLLVCAKIVSYVKNYI